MGFAKWIGASLGWSFGGPIGAIIGLALGSLVDSMKGNSSPLLGESQPRSRSRRGKLTTGQDHSKDHKHSLVILK